MIGPSWIQGNEAMDSCRNGAVAGIMSAEMKPELSQRALQWFDGDIVDTH